MRNCEDSAPVPLSNVAVVRPVWDPAEVVTPARVVRHRLRSIKAPVANAIVAQLLFLDREDPEREIQRLGVDGRERLVGENQDVRPYLASMDIFVLTSVAVETFSNAALEAMAMSCPVVVSRVGGMEEMLRHGGGMSYAPGDVKSLCDLLMPLVSSAAARAQLGAEARQAAEKHFSFSRMLRDFEERVLTTP